MSRKLLNLVALGAVALMVTTFSGQSAKAAGLFDAFGIFESLGNTDVELTGFLSGSSDCCKPAKCSSPAPCCKTVSKCAPACAPKPTCCAPRPTCCKTVSSCCATAAPKVEGAPAPKVEEAPVPPKESSEKKKEA